MTKRIIRAALWLFAVLLALALAACGGDTTDHGGNSNSGDSGDGGDGTSYTVYYFEDAVGGTAAEVKVRAESGNSLPPATKAHYTFLGYYTAEGVQLFDAAGKQTDGLLIDKNITVYARFAPINYTVSFAVGEGTLPAGAGATATLNADTWLLIAPVPTPATASLQFEGWYNKEYTVCYADENGTVDYTQFSLNNGLAIENGEIKLYAKYGVRTVTVTLNYNDFNYGNVTLKIPYGTAVGDLASYKKQNEASQREVVGFSTSSYELIPPGGALENDITLFAIWKNYKYVTLVYGTDDERVSKIFDGGVNGAELPEATKPGYSFDGWYTSATLSGNPVGYVSFSALATRYYAKFTITDYTLTFETGGDEIAAPMTYYYGDVTALPTLTRLGYTLEGWSLAPDGTGTVMTGIPADLYGNYTLYAVWAPQSYFVTLNPNGGAATQGGCEVLYGAGFGIPAATREGYTFLGWYSSTEADAVRYTNGQGTGLFTWRDTEPVTLYAHWQIKTYTVIFDTNGGGKIANKTYKYGALMTLPTPATAPAANKVFYGWFDTAMTKEYTGRIAVTENIDLVALWVESTPISDAAGLFSIAAAPSGVYHLISDINLGGAPWTPIEEFSGILNGQGHKIYNFTLGQNGNYTAFVGKNSGKIKNLVLDNMVGSHTCTGSATCYVSGVVGDNLENGVINACTVTNTAFTVKNSYGEGKTVYAYVGSFAGHNKGVIVDCTSTATFNVSYYGSVGSGWSDATYHGYAGGIAGRCTESSTVWDCSFEGEITGTCSSKSANHAYSKSYFHCGGILGLNYGTCLSSYANATVTVTGAWTAETNSSSHYDRGLQELFVGGAIGYNEASGTVAFCYSKGAVSLRGRVIDIGGFIGYNEGTVTDCYSTAAVTGLGGQNRDVGGFVGENEKSISNCYATGDVSNKSGTCGGFMGSNAASGTVLNCYATGNVSNETADNRAHAFSEYNNGTFNRCYYNGAAVVSKGGTVIEHQAMVGTAATDVATLQSADFLYNTLYWDSFYWITDTDTYPKLYWQS